MKQEYEICLFMSDSFIDFSMTDYKFDKASKTLMLHISAADLANGESLKNITIEITNWSLLRVVETLPNNAERYIQPKRFITSVMEFHSFIDKIVLRDVGMNSWIDWCFYDCEIKITGEPDDD